MTNQAAAMVAILAGLRIPRSDYSVRTERTRRQRDGHQWTEYGEAVGIVGHEAAGLAWAARDILTATGYFVDLYRHDEKPDRTFVRIASGNGGATAPVRAPFRLVMPGGALRVVPIGSAGPWHYGKEDQGTDTNNEKGDG